ncbi:MAG: ATP-dependent RNA helicase HrpA [Pseudomonadota bacterium]
MKTNPGHKAPATSADDASAASLDALAGAIDECLLVDQARFRKSAERLARRAAKKLPIDRGLARLAEDVRRSQGAAAGRRESPMDLTCPAALPVSARQQEIFAAIDKHQVLILCGDTGSGKTTQLPKICLALGRGVHGRVGHTQPRRLAARAAAARIAKETATALGSAIGYAVRFDERIADNTRVKLMTDGILLNEIHNDPKLLQYDTLIIDEAHERSLNIDFLLGYIKRLLPQRPDLKVIVTSATLDPERLSAHFADAPVLKVEGRTFPVTLRYEAPDGNEEVADSIARTVAGLPAADETSDVLVFLPGEQQIREAARALEKHPKVNADILPLLARLSAREQDKVFNPGKRQRVILATNIAETSLTVPRIRYVIDTGTARIKRYNAKARIEQLGIEPVSQASANQRMGRCGRLQDGVCIRLYAEEDFADRTEFTDPEIVRSNLASVILKMAILGLGDIEKFAFVDPPHTRYIRDGYRLLKELGAVDARERVTPTGRRMARLPVDPQFARIVLAAPEHGCLREILTIVSGLSVQDPRERPLDKRAAADECHAVRHDARSDFIALLTLWQDYEKTRGELGSSALRRWCREQFLSAHRMREWRDVRRQLNEVARELSLALNDDPADYAPIHRALLAGLPAHVGFHEQRGDYRGVRNSQFRLFPGSGVAAKKPKWVVCSELVLTGRLYGRTVASVKPRWIEIAAAHLVKRTVSEPEWSSSSGEVDAFETVSLQGLVLASRRRVRFAAHDRAGARQVFIEQALVPMAPSIKAPFNERNVALMNQVRAVEARLRRPAVIDDDNVRHFFERQLPETVTGRRELNRWLQADKKGRNDALSLTASDLGSLPVADPAAYPDTLEWQGNALALRYAFDPREADDGATLEVPVALLLELPATVTEWGVPAWLQDKVVAVIRQLPKALRKHFVPVPDTAARFLAAPAVAAARQGGEGFYATLARWLSDHAGVVVRDDDVAGATLPAYLELHVRIIGEHGKALATDNDLNVLKMRFAGAAKTARESNAGKAEQPRFTAWDFGPLTGVVRRQQNGLQLTRYPALADLGDSVRLESRDSAATAKAVTTDGVIRLFRLRFPSQSRYVERRLLPKQEGELLAVRLGGIKELAQDLTWLTFHDVFLKSAAAPILGRDAFEEAAERHGSELVERGYALADLLLGILKAHHELRMSLPHPVPEPQAPGIADIERQLDDLLAPGFLRRTPVEWLECYPRYLKAAAARVKRLPDRVQQDAAAAATIRGWLARWQSLSASAKGEGVAACEELRWMIEEYRVSLFAQGLGTRYPVSEKRLERLAVRAGR